MTLLEYGCATAASTSNENRAGATDEVYNIRKYALSNKKMSLFIIVSYIYTTLQLLLCLNCFFK